MIRLFLFAIFVAALSTGCTKNPTPEKSNSRTGTQTSQISKDNVPSSPSGTQIGSNVFILKAIGDLNKDSIPDSVVVTQDTSKISAPYTLKVFFGSQNSTYTEAVTSDSAIPPKYPNGRDAMDNGESFSKISISRNVLTISNELLRGNYSHKFRFQNGNFELIGFSEVSTNGTGICTTIDFNLSTGVYCSKEESIESDQDTPFKKEIRKVRPLPKLQEFSPWSFGSF